MSRQKSQTAGRADQDVSDECSGTSGNVIASPSVSPPLVVSGKPKLELSPPTDYAVLISVHRPLPTGYAFLRCILNMPSCAPLYSTPGYATQLAARIDVSGPLAVCAPTLLVIWEFRGSCATIICDLGIGWQVFLAVTRRRFTFTFAPYRESLPRRLQSASYSTNTVRDLSLLNLPGLRYIRVIARTAAQQSIS